VSELDVILAAMDTPDKSNEITVSPELLHLLEIKGCVVTIDAMGLPIEGGRANR